LEVLEQLRRELLSWLPLGREKKLLGEVVAAAPGVEVVAAAPGVEVVAATPRVAVAEKKSFTEEREKWCNHHVRWFGGYLRSG
jgi:hypothetical protein